MKKNISLISSRKPFNHFKRDLFSNEMKAYNLQINFPFAGICAAFFLLNNWESKDKLSKIRKIILQLFVRFDLKWEKKEKLSKKFELIKAASMKMIKWKTEWSKVQRNFRARNLVWIVLIFYLLLNPSLNLCNFIAQIEIVQKINDID